MFLGVEDVTGVPGVVVISISSVVSLGVPGLVAIFSPHMEFPVMFLLCSSV